MANTWQTGFLRDDSGALVVSGADGQLPLKLGNYYSFPHTGLGAGAPNLNEMRMAPVVIPNGQVRFDRMEVEVTVAGAGAVIRLAAYEDRDGLPYQLLAAPAPMDGGTIGLKTATIDIAASGRVWLAVVVQAVACTLRTATGLSYGLPQPSGATYMRGCYSAYGVSGAVPPTPTQTPGIDSTDIGRVALRVA